MSLKNIIIVILTILLATVAGVGGYLYMSTREKVEPVFKVSIDEPQIKTNLKDSKKMVVLSFEIEYTGKELTEEIKTKETEIRDLVLTILRSKTPDDIDGSVGKEKVKNEIVKGLKKVLNTENIRDVFFKEFFVTG